MKIHSKFTIVHSSFIFFSFSLVIFCAKANAEEVAPGVTLLSKTISGKDSHITTLYKSNIISSNTPSSVTVNTEPPTGGSYACRSSVQIYSSHFATLINSTDSPRRYYVQAILNGGWPFHRDFVEYIYLVEPNRKVDINHKFERTVALWERDVSVGAFTYGWREGETRKEHGRSVDLITIPKPCP